MSIVTHFKSGRSEPDGAFTSDRSGSSHARFMRLSAYALAPLGVLASWYLAGVAGKSLEGVRAEIAHPLPALTLMAFAALGMLHAYHGMNEIIEDYVHDDALKHKAILANKFTAIVVVALWTLAVAIIAAPH